ncbi:MAG: phenylalanine--tRNA ligase subunit beta [Acidobacteriota bacterium]|nr:phenylalanine--tRNA ligase subunit beta [Acidobacteriota bacterium]
MKVLLSWIREFVDVPESAEDIGTLMSVRGLALEGLDPHGDDVVMDFDVTANRPDCLSMIGIAREIATAYNRPLRSEGDGFSRRHPAGAETPALRTSTDAIPVTIEAPDLCGRYVGAIADVTVGPSPQWLQDRLSACGIRPISNVVDITNYVLLELGQPMHAFDLDKLAGPGIVVRRAKPGESITTLDGKKRTLTSDMLVIADTARAQAIGGVMGGAESEVSATTTRIVFEAAHFTPSSVRKTSKTLGLKTDASTRFERGMDVTAPARAMARACQLLEQIAAGKAAGTIEDVYPAPQPATSLVLERAGVSGLLGMDVPDANVERILRSLGFDVRSASAKASTPAEAAADGSAGHAGWSITAPAWRVDIKRPVDLIEEVGRHHGFEHLPSTFPGVQQAPASSDPRIVRDRRVRTALLGMGYSEAITFAFIEAVAAEPFLSSTTLGAGGREAPVALANPLSEKFAVMRPSLLPGLIDAVSHNRRHGRRDVQLFEIGTRFSPRGESRGAAFAWTGLATADHWSGARREVDFFDVKGVIEQLAAVSLVTPAFAETDVPYLVKGRAAGVVVNGQHVGVVGLLAPSVADRRDLPTGDEVYVAEINLDLLTAQAPAGTLRANALPRFPWVVRDVSILVDDALSAGTVRGTIRSAAPGTLIDIREFDRYQGKGIPDGKVSLSFRLTFQSPERTLTDEEVQAGMQHIIDALTRDLQATQR